MAETALEPSPLKAVAPVAELPAAIRPTWYYGWAMLPLSMAALIASSPGQTFGISVFNEPMRTSLELTHGQLALGCSAIPERVDQGEGFVRGHAPPYGPRRRRSRSSRVGLGGRPPTSEVKTACCAMRRPRAAQIADGMRDDVAGSSGEVGKPTGCRTTRC